MHRDVEKTDLGMVGLGDFLLRIGALGDSPFHVGLPGANPDFAHEHVLELDLVVPLDRQGRGLGTCLQFVEFDHPLAILAGDGAFFLPTEGDGDLFSLVGPTPDGNGHVALEDHVRIQDVG